MKRLLITGATGFTGKHLSAFAEIAGYKVLHLHSDLTHVQELRKELSEIDTEYVVHLAANSSITHTDPLALYRVNLFGTLNLLDAFRFLQIKPHKIILASSANVYGNLDMHLISESICPRPVNHYGCSKLAMEQMAATYANDLNLVVVRPFNYTGVGHDTRFVVPKIVEHFKLGAPTIELGNLDVYREYNDVRMICEIYLKLLDVGTVCQTYNVCSGRAYSLRDVISMSEKMTGKRIRVSVNEQFVRTNELHTLVGNPEKLKTVVGDLQTYSLENTLAWMLGSN